MDYDLRQQNIFWRPLFNLVYAVTEGVSSVGPKILEIIPENSKS